jgi:hypothetical protein
MEDDMGGAGSAYGGDKKAVQNFGLKAWREESTQK